MKHKKKLVYFLVASAVMVSSTTFGGQAFAATLRDKSPQTAVELGFDKGDHYQRVFGKVTAINGDTLMVTDQKGTIYSVNASSAGLPAGVKVGDEVSVRGTINAVGIVATA